MAMKTRMWTMDFRPVLCHEEVTRRGEFAPCDKPAVGYKLDDDGSSYYPVCNEHLKSGWGMQP